jgi:hypothetical protein
VIRNLVTTRQLANSSNISEPEQKNDEDFTDGSILSLFDPLEFEEVQ